MTSPRIGVVVVSYQAVERAARLAQGLAEQGVRPHDVVVADNGSEPEEQASAEKIWSDGTWLHLRNPGFGAAANAGERSLPYGVDLVAVLADDVALSPGTLEGLAETLADDHVGVAGPALLDARDGSVWSHGGTIAGRDRNPHHLRPERDYPGPPLWLDDAVMMMRRDDFRALGGFDEAWHLYYEDVDLGLRVARDLGKAVVCRTDLTATKVPDDNLTPFLDTSGRLRLQRRHGGPVPLAILLADTLARLVAGCLKHPRETPARLLDRARALRAGLRG